MNTKKENDKWFEGVEYGKQLVFHELYQQSSKDQFLKRLHGLASNAAEKEKDETEKLKLSSYSEGIRHCLNVLSSLGDPEEAYKNIINPYFKVKLK